VIAGGFDAATVKRIARLVDINEYKRRQSAPGVKITSKAFGKERRYPITSAFGHRHHS
jgi:NAD+ synthase (glutamine-hydrolysing)